MRQRRLEESRGTSPQHWAARPGRRADACGALCRTAAGGAARLGGRHWRRCAASGRLQAGSWCCRIGGLETPTWLLAGKERRGEAAPCGTRGGSQLRAGGAVQPGRHRRELPAGRPDGVGERNVRRAVRCVRGTEALVHGELGSTGEFKSRAMLRFAGCKGTLKAC